MDAIITNYGQANNKRLTDIDNFIYMCRQNIEGVKPAIAGKDKIEMPWEDWINDAIDCAFLIIDADISYHKTDYNKVFKYSTYIAWSSFNKDEVKTFLASIKNIGPKERSINLINLFEIMKYNIIHENEYIRKSDNVVVKKNSPNIDVYIGDAVYECVGINDGNSSFMIEADVFNKEYTPNVKVFDYKVDNELKQEISVDHFDFYLDNEIIY